MTQQTQPAELLGKVIVQLCKMLGTLTQTHTHTYTHARTHAHTDSHEYLASALARQHCSVTVRMAILK